MRGFFGGDWLISRLGGGDRKDATGDQQSGSALAIVLGTVLDGIPESMVIAGRSSKGAGWAPRIWRRSSSPTCPKRSRRRPAWPAVAGKKSRILWMWIAIAIVSGLASLAGYRLFQDASPATVAFVLTFAAAAILTMLADTMMPEAFEHGGKLVGVVTTLGFATAYAIHTLG
jgi:zinc transporter, ZIP family